MRRLNEVAWRIRVAAGELCPTQSNGIGASFDYIGAYSETTREDVRKATGLSQLPRVTAVAANSPAQQAGLQPGDEIEAVRGMAIADLLAKDANPALFADTLEVLVSAGPPGSVVPLKVRRAGRPLDLAVQGKPVCSAQIVYKFESGVDAYADPATDRIAVTSGMISFNEDDAALAMVVAHELGHVIRRDGKAGSIGRRRAMEDRADMIGGGLVRCAGYDIGAATEFYRHYHRKDWLRWIRDPSHRSMAKRSDRVLKTPDDIACPLTPEGLERLVAAAGG